MIAAMRGQTLTADGLRDLVNYDPGTGIMMWRQCGHGRQMDKPVGTPNSHGHLITRIDYRIHYVHRLVFLFMTGRWPVTVDHINGDRSDNRWSNLREATPEQNNRNRRRSSRNGSGAKNVHWFKQYQCWRVTVKANGKEHFIGHYTDKADAVTASHDAMRRLHGEFARLD